MKLSVRVFLISLLCLGIGYILFSSHTPSVVAQVSCEPRYDNTMLTPPGYATSYNVFSTIRELILNTSCPTNDALFMEGSEDTTNPQYVYRTAYRWDGTHWVEVIMHGVPVPGTGGAWLKAVASTTIAKSVFRPAGMYNFLAGYTCTFVNGAWKCGCRNAVCGVSLWQLQAFRSPLVLTPGPGCGPSGDEWVPFTTITLLPTDSVTKLGVTPSDLALIIQQRTGDSSGLSMEEANRILASTNTLADLGIDSPITVTWSGITLTVSYKDKFIQMATRNGVTGELVWQPLSFDPVPITDRPDGWGVAYFVEAAIFRNFKYGTAAEGFLVRSTLKGSPACSMSALGGTATAGTASDTTTDGAELPAPPGFPEITPCGSPVSVTPSSLSSNLGAGCRILNLSPGNYGMLRINGHTGGVLTLKCIAVRQCNFNGGSTGVPNITNSDGIVLDGLAWTGGYLTLEDSKNIRVQNSSFRNLVSSGLVVNLGDPANQVNIQLVANDVYSDSNRIESTLSNGSKNYTMDYGFRIYNAKSIYIANNTFNGGFNHAISLKEGVGYALIENNTFISCGRNCIEPGQEPISSTNTNDCQNITSDEAMITKNTFSGGGLIGVLIKNIRKVSVVSNSFEGFQGKTVSVVSFSPGEQIGSCTVEGTGVPANREVIQN